MMKSNIFIETPRLIIKHLDRSDFFNISMQQKDPDFMKFFGGPRNDKDIVVIFDLLLKHLVDCGFSQGPIFLKETGECIGRAGLLHLELDKTLDLELGYFLLPRYWKKGFATELGFALINYAFNILGKSRIYASVDPENIASCRVSEKLGMIFEREGNYERLGKTKIGSQ